MIAKANVPPYNPLIDTVTMFMANVARTQCGLSVKTKTRKQIRINRTTYEMDGSRSCCLLDIKTVIGIVK